MKAKHQNSDNYFIINSFCSVNQNIIIQNNLILPYKKESHVTWNVHIHRIKGKNKGCGIVCAERMTLWSMCKNCSYYNNFGGKVTPNGVNISQHSLLFCVGYMPWCSFTADTNLLLKLPINKTNITLHEVKTRFLVFCSVLTTTKHVSNKSYDLDVIYILLCTTFLYNEPLLKIMMKSDQN